MEVFKLLGTIAVDNSEANEALAETGAEGEKSEGKLSKAFGAIGKGAVACGKVIATGLAVGATAMGALITKAVSLSGELEQNMGGSEAVFGEHAEKMQEKAKEAFSEMGLSTSEYLATANKMGSLLKGAGFTQEEAMNRSSEAMQRAADVASIMGLDTTAAMEAIAGAAKGNFTMMDNLGVAMNDTTLNAYALEKGINKTTQEMTNQEKIGLAMDMFLEKTADYAGNYANENETLAGSLGTAKAALTNFLDGSGDVDSLVDAFSNAATVIVENVTTIAPRLVEGIVDLVNQIVPLLPGLMEELLPPLIDGAVVLIEGLLVALPDLIQKLLPPLIEGVVELINALLDALPDILKALLDALPMLIKAVEDVVTAIVDALPDIIQVIVDALPTIIPMLIDSITNIIVTICNKFGEIIQPLIDALPGIIICIVEALVRNLPALIEGIINLVMSIVEAIPQIIQGIVDALPTIISMIIESLLSNLPLIIQGLIRVIWGIVQSLPQIFGSLIQGIINIFVGIWDGIKNFFQNSGIGEWFANIFGKAKEGIMNAWSNVKEFFSGIWDGIKEAFSAVGEWFSNLFSGARDGIKNAFSSVGSFFSGVWDGIKNAFSSVGNWFKNIFSKAWDGVKNVFSGVKSFFTGIWDKIKSAFSAIGTKIGDAVSGAVKKGINGLIGAAEKIINGFLKMINGAINMINKIPGVNISKVKLVEFTRLAEGGVVDEPTPAVFGEDGAEAVVPLEKNQGWLKKVAQNLHSFIAETAPNKNGSALYGYQSQSSEGRLAAAIRADVEAVKDTLAVISEILDLHLPGIRERMEYPIPAVVGVDQAADALTEPINYRMGILAAKEGRGR